MEAIIPDVVAFDGVTDRVALLRERIGDAAIRSGRDGADVTLLAVSKRFSAETLEAVRETGILDFGENYVQEAQEKAILVSLVRWHLIGGLQKNKAKAAVSLFSLIQSLDSVSLAQALQRHAAEQGKTQDVLVQVNLSREPGRSGVMADAASALCELVSNMSSLRLCGMMGLPPEGDADGARAHFRVLKALYDELPTENRQILSMGMSGDFEVAVEEGSTMVRIGTALFGERQNK